MEGRCCFGGGGEKKHYVAIGFMPIYTRILSYLFRGHRITYMTIPCVIDACYGKNNQYPFSWNVWDALFFLGNEKNHHDLSDCLKDCRIPCYAFMMYPVPAISSLRTARWLHAFDHVFVETQADAFYAIQQLGSANVSYLPNLLFLLQPEWIPLSYLYEGGRQNIRSLAQSTGSESLSSQSRIKIGCYLSPMMDVDTSVLLFKQLHAIFLADIYLISETPEAYAIDQVRIVSDPSTNGGIYLIRDNISTTRLDLMVQSMDLVIASSYTVIILSILLRKPFVAVVSHAYLQGKLKDLLQDLNMKECMVEIGNANALDTASQVKSIVETLSISVSQTPVVEWTSYLLRGILPKDVSICTTRLSYRRSLRYLLQSVQAHRLDLLYRTKRKILNAQFLAHVSIRPNRIRLYERERFLKGCAWLNDLQMASRENVSRLVTFIGTGGCITHAYYSMVSASPWKHWNDPVLLELLDVIRNEHVNKQMDSIKQMTHRDAIHRTAWNMASASYIHLHAFCQKNHANYRSGWSRVHDALHVFDASLLAKDTETAILCDLYVDRTFLHGGGHVLHALHILPYKTPWIGFMRHGFHEACHPYGGQDLFQHDLWLASLRFCKGLITFSKKQANCVEHALQKVGFSDVRVFTIDFPTVPPSFHSLFRFSRFMSHAHKRLLTIGRWMRDTPAFYQLHAPQMYQKTIIIRDFDDDFMEEQQDMQEQHYLEVIKKRSSTNTSIMQSAKKGVDVWMHVPAGRVEELLAEHIVFLKLWDVTMCHTVLQCIVRGTPILLNRHPVLEELLGASYPGFYDTLDQAAAILQSVLRIYCIHVYLRYGFSQHRFSMDRFLRKMAGILGHVHMRTRL